MTPRTVFLCVQTSLLAHDQRLQELLRMIPAKYYIPQHQFSLTPLQNTNSHKSGKKQKKTHQPVDPETKRLQKRAKYDPDSLPTIPQLQGLNKSTDDSPESTPAQQHQQQQEAPNSQESQEENHATKEAASQAPQLSRVELQAKLQKRIESLQESTQRSNPNTEALEVSGKDALLDLERKKRGEMRDRRRKERKAARSKEKQLKLLQQQSSNTKKNPSSSSSKPSTAPSGSGNLQKGGKATKDDLEIPKDASSKTLSEKQKPGSSPSQSDKPQGSKSSSAAAHNGGSTQEPDLAFSSLSFEVKQAVGTDGGGPSHGARNPSWTSKKPQEAKMALDRREAYLAKLTPEARERAEESKKWEKATLQASGTKVMDDRKKLEKALKKQNKEKKKKKHQWDERLKVVEKLKLDKQKKRADNIQARKDQIRDKKNGVKAKGNRRPTNHKSHKGGSGSKKSVQGF
ncbi:hypothetical protein VP01_1212g4 [Puccinia sorghi]|uniref:Ribosomal RNA-processing protein 14/surfeit locus protein 6 C-terminal domain-containing protein n=1 Tax=Puccinia sorghi TaxID=27349 RepID=A0A0L6VQF4_9BASI|nr:hypothetical protein VP01_1212g4 [Puccinia sorghi]